MLVRIGHFNIRTPHLEATLAFYEEVLGLQRGPAATMTDQTRNAWLFDAQGRAVVHVNMPGKDEDAPSLGTLLDHVAFDCENLEEMRGHLKQLGVIFVERNSRVSGLSQITLADPNGIKLELTFGTDLVRRATHKVD